MDRGRTFQIRKSLVRRICTYFPIVNIATVYSNQSFAFSFPITILAIVEKVFKVAVYRRMLFANEAMGKIDKYNGGFINGSRTSDNIFILNGLIQRRLVLGQSLFVCFVGFSKSFDLVNRHILFFYIMKEGWHGRVIDTLRNLYTKTHFRVKRNGKLSAPIASTLGVNQIGVASVFFISKIP